MPDTPAPNPAPTDPAKPPEPLAPPVTAVHQIVINGELLRYRVTTGMLPIQNPETGETEASMFFMAYTVVDAADEPHAGATRPLLFSFNGGPGSASVWLHLGALGPKIVPMANEKGDLPAPPYAVKDNPYTWLKNADLVFIDPVGTGYSRPAKPDLGKKFWSVKGDIESIGEFIRLYLARYERWGSRLFLAGESYGTTRAAGIAGYLVDRGIAFSGIILVSAVTQFQTLLFDAGNDLPYILFLPGFTATAFYHGRLAPELSADLETTLRESETFAEGAYAAALQRGDRLQGGERDAIAAEYARLTGLSAAFVAGCDLRVSDRRFFAELLRADQKTVGRLDSRFAGYPEVAVAESAPYDAAMATIMPPYTTAFNAYVRAELGYKTDAPYHILGTGINGEWDWQSPNAYVETASALRAALVKNPHLRIFVASGYYDLATPYFATEYTLSHMHLPRPLRANVTTRYYEAGHMMYVHAPSLARLAEDVAGFIRES